MAAGLILMILLGCGDAGEQCERIGATTASYTSLAACQAAIVYELPRQTGVAYPVIAAQCESTAPSVMIASLAR